MNTGTWYAVSAYTLWGLLPVYWKWLRHVPALQLMSHRVVWSFVSLCTFLVITRRWSRFRAAIGDKRVLRIHLITAALIGINWLTYVWAVNAGFVVETSLGYFINPLLSVALGVIFLRERLRPLQWTAVGIAAMGVFYLTFIYGTFPWIALTLALAFGFYGLVKKTAPMGSLYGLTLETGILLPPTLGYLLFWKIQGEGAFLHTGPLFDLLLVGAGPTTAVPLLLFAAAAQRIPLSLVGILQYIAPTLQFLLGVLVYHEPFPPTRFVGFSLVWIALAILALDAGLTRRARIPVKPRKHRRHRGPQQD
ncbi:MAG TPA: EamA family transporter RarD [Anaerolineae bacterium]|nr:EamA family transporter RarD [Anaerolineae bacterium]